jgi:maltose/maltodextrin transport system permease protein
MNTLAARAAPHPGMAWGRWLPWVAVAAGLLAVMQVHAAGQTLLATLLLVIVALAGWTYTNPRTHALRYLFPGLAAAVIFVVFPMLYTVGLGFTNYSSRNLMDEAEAHATLLSEATAVPGTRHAFSLHAAEGGQWRLKLQAAEGSTLITGPLKLDPPAQGQVAPPQEVPAVVDAADLGAAAPLRDIVDRLQPLRALKLRTPSGVVLSFTGLRDFTQLQPLYRPGPGDGLTDQLSGTVYRPDRETGFFTNADGGQLQPGFRVVVGLRHYATVFSESKFREPFLGVFVWTVMFSALTVIGSAALGMLLAVLFNWEALPYKGAYRLVLFLPYAVPGFISILVFKGLFNQNLGEVNLILESLFGIRPAWFSDPLLARATLLIVNIWLGFPYMMVLCSGLIKSIPADLYEASALLGAGPWANFRRITLPLILKPLTPLLISAFAFNFNNFVLISLLTGGRPDYLDSTLPAGTTDILVSYTWRIAFQDSGQQFGLAAAISTIIFLLVAAVTLIQLRFTRIAERDGR